MSTWLMALNLNYADVKGNFSGYTWYKDGTATTDPTSTNSNAMTPNDTVYFCVAASNAGNATLDRLVLTVGRFPANTNSAQTLATPFTIDNTTTGAAECLYERTAADGSWTTLPSWAPSGYTGIGPFTVMNDASANGAVGKYEFTMVAVYNQGGSKRQFGCDPEIDVDNNAP